MNKQQKSLFPGIALIIFGLWLALRNSDIMLNIWGNIYPALILVLAVVLLYDAEKSKSGGSIFWGTSLFLISVFFVLRNYELMPFYYIDEYWPIFLFAAGMGFLALFVIKQENRGAIIPAVILLFLGVSNGLETFDIVDWDFENFFSDYWPACIVLIGVGLIVTSLKSKGTNNQ